MAEALVQTARVPDPGIAKLATGSRNQAGKSPGRL